MGLLISKCSFSIIFSNAGKYLNHKGRNRKFTNPDELENQRLREEKEKQWRKTRGDIESSSDEDENSEESEGSSSEEESDPEVWNISE